MAQYVKSIKGYCIAADKTTAGKDIAVTDGSYPSMVVGKATSADSATKAAQDGSGQNIVLTYLTKEDAAMTYATKGGVTGALVPSGSKTLSTLPDPSSTTLGLMFNMSEGFSTTDIFLEGAGKYYPAGTNVAVVKSGDTYLYDVMTGAIDLTPYATKAELTSQGGTVVYEAIYASEADKATQDGNGNTIVQTYATKTELNTLSQTVSQNSQAVSSMTNTISAITTGMTVVGKANADADGKVISTTYAKIDATVLVADLGIVEF